MKMHYKQTKKKMKENFLLKYFLLNNKQRKRTDFLLQINMK